MGDYLISPPEQTDLHIDPAHLAETLRIRWLDAEVRSPSVQDISRSLEWELQMNGRVLMGALARAGDAVYLDGDVRDCAIFAQWFRTQIPSRYNLVFYDEAYTADIELHDTTSKESIAEPFLQQ